MKNFTMSEITRELREVKVVAHDHWKDTTDKNKIGNTLILEI